MSEWISVKDRLPDKPVLCVNNYNDMYIGYIGWDDEQEWYEAELDGIYLTNVTHWQPLPQPPREVE